MSGGKPVKYASGGNRNATRTYTLISSTAIAAVSPAPTTGQYLVIDGITASCDAAINVTLTVESANSTAIGKFYFAAGGLVNWTPQGLFKLPTVTKKLNAKTSGAGNVAFQVFTHSEA